MDDDGFPEGLAGFRRAGVALDRGLFRGCELFRYDVVFSRWNFSIR